MININRHQALYFSQHKYFQQTQVVYQGDIFWVYLCIFCLGNGPRCNARLFLCRSDS